MCNSYDLLSIIRARARGSHRIIAIADRRALAGAAAAAAAARYIRV
eukprot:COSAG01_NODE_5135_length_4461_cov_2.300779_1_plen_46_part_00